MRKEDLTEIEQKRAYEIVHTYNVVNKRNFQAQNNNIDLLFRVVNLNDAERVGSCILYIRNNPSPVKSSTEFEDTILAWNNHIESLGKQPSPTPTPIPTPTPTPSTTDSNGILNALLMPVINELTNAKASEIMKDVNGVIDTFRNELEKKLSIVPTRIQLECDELEIPKDELYHREFEHCLQYARNHVNIMLTGESGTGKTHLCTQLAKVLKLDFYSANAVTDPYALSGYKDVNGNFVETDFYKAYTKGGLFLLDEMDGSSAEALITLNTAIDNGFMAFQNGVKQMHEDFTLVATANTFGEGADYKYVGRNQLDSATLNRFAVIKIDYDPNIELAVCGNNVELCEFAREFRKACSKTNTLCITSYRAIKNIAKFESIQDLDYVIQVNLTKSLTREELEKILNQFNLGSNKYYKACKKLVA